MGNYKYFCLILLSLPLVSSLDSTRISTKTIDQCNDVCKSYLRCPEKVAACSYGCKNYQELSEVANVESETNCNKACKTRYTDGDSFSHPMPPVILQESCFTGCKIRSGAPLPPMPARMPMMLVKFDSDVSFDSPLKMFNRMLQRMGFSSSEEEMMSPLHDTEESLFVPPKLPRARESPIDIGKPVVQFWSADQVQIDARGIRIRHRDSDHPDAVETVISAGQLPSAAGRGPGAGPNIALPPPKQIVHEIAMPKGPPLNIARHFGPSRLGEEIEKRTIQEQLVGGTQVNMEAVDEAPIHSVETSESWVNCWRRFVERHRRCRHRWIAHSLFGLLFGLSVFFLIYHLTGRRRHHRHHKHHGEKTDGNPTYVIALPPSYEELYSSDKKSMQGTEVIVAVSVPEGANVNEDKKPLLAP